MYKNYTFTRNTSTVTTAVQSDGAAATGVRTNGTPTWQAVGGPDAAAALAFEVERMQLQEHAREAAGFRIQLYWRRHCVSRLALRSDEASLPAAAEQATGQGEIVVTKSREKPSLF